MTPASREAAYQESRISAREAPAKHGRDLRYPNDPADPDERTDAPGLRRLQGPAGIDPAGQASS
jgi:hypothetical protein